MNSEILNALPFTRTARFYLENLNSKKYHKIPVYTIKHVICEYSFKQNNGYHVDQIIGHLHRIINKNRMLFFMQKLDLNFLLISIRRDLEDYYDRINGYNEDLNIFQSSSVESEEKLVELGE